MTMSPEGFESSAIFQAIAQASDESAAVAQFLELYEKSPIFRHWLKEDYCRNAEVRSRVDVMVSEKAVTPGRFANLSGEGLAWEIERRELKAKLPECIYGGLTYGEIEALILQHISGKVDPGAFLLAEQWQRAEASGSRSIVLARAAFAVVNGAFQAGEFRTLRHMEKANRLLDMLQDKSKRRAFLGYAGWWKLQVLLFILRHPNESYRTREIRAHLAGRGLDVSTKDIRRFCARNRIRRDMRSGRPRARKTERHAGTRMRG